MAHEIVERNLADRAATKARAEASKVARREAREAKKMEKPVGKKRARE